jgi:hypothetical protein|tara:strand:- start:284 stop:433 length:150 start_codon:yes stop_codon:yes gene_type:complete
MFFDSLTSKWVTQASLIRKNTNDNIFTINQMKQGQLVNALAMSGDEGRG